MVLVDFLLPCILSLQSLVSFNRLWNIDKYNKNNPIIRLKIIMMKRLDV